MNTSIEETIDRVEQLYAAITGQQPPHLNGNGARIPPEIDPARHVEEQLARLVAAVEQRLAEPSRQAVWMPRASAWHDDAGFELAIDVPGIAREQLELRIEGQVLAVRGERRAPWQGPADGETRSPVTCEAPLGSFARSFVLPDGVEPSQITARLEAGVLRVRIPRRATPQGSGIPIQG